MLFFKSYTEKVWCLSTTEIRAEWAAQRIKGVSFFTAARSALLGRRGSQVKSLIHEFHYPRYGPGQMWEAMAVLYPGRTVDTSTSTSGIRDRDRRPQRKR